MTAINVLVNVAVVVPDIITDPVEAAKAAHLRYATDDDLCIVRKHAGKGFTYVGADGKPIHDVKVLDRIKSLGIPPAWTEVRICANPNGHIQAVGRDAKGRKQYRYHPRWREIRDENKFNRMIAFGEALPQIRERVDKDLALPGLPREKVLALAIRLMELTLIRVGNEEYVKENKSFGLTTLRDRHVNVSGSTIQFHFRGKSGKDHSIHVVDRRLARLVKRCKDIPGQELFQYMDDHRQRQSISSADVNTYLRDISGQDFTAKDFRTWGGTVASVLAFQRLGPCDSETQVKKNIVQVVKDVANHLGNTPTICRKYYLHPALIDAYTDQSLFDVIEQGTDDSPYGLRPEEQVVMAVLRIRAAASAG